jgi:vacuolar-type H+-ATPase subunit E/Vma4
VKGLDPVRAIHLEGAHARAEAIVRDARAEAGQIIARSTADADALTEQAEREGESSADLDTNRGWTAARRRARGILLAAQKDVYDELRSAVAGAIQSDARYESFLLRLADEARRRLGPGAEVHVDGSEVRGTRQKRHVRWSLQDLIDDSLGRLGSDVEELWR